MLKSLFCLACVFLFAISPAQSENQLNKHFEKIIFGSYTADLDEFEEFVIRAKQSGATHINISNEDLPLAKWEYDTEGDPYPAWVHTNIGLLKIATPDALKPYLPGDYAEELMIILESRCKILRKHDLKASLRTFEPQMLPEKVFTDHPLWRGPRVDHPSRSTVARWAPDIDNPEVLKLYSEALSILLDRCPEIEVFSLTTNDSGTGLSWSGGLYSGATGNTFHKYRPMDERLFGFFATLQEAASNHGGSLEIDIMWTRESFPKRIAQSLSKGMAIENFEGPDATPFKYQVGDVMDYFQLLHPVNGIPDPLRFIEDLENAAASKAKRLMVLIGDRPNRNMYFELYDLYGQYQEKGLLARLSFLEGYATEDVGKENSNDYLNLWHTLYNLRKPFEMSKIGGTVISLGCLHQRWLTRPFVPFPGELRPEDRDYFRKYQFQARTEEHANNMADLQAMQSFSGEGGMMFIMTIMQEAKRSISKARGSIHNLLASEMRNEQKNELKVLDLRLQALTYLCNNAQNAVHYQEQLDRVLRRGVTPDQNPPIHKPSEWERNIMMETARKEIDNTAYLLHLLDSTDENLLDIAPTKELEDIRRFGPDLKDQLRKKLRIMNEHWQDYNRLFTSPTG